MKKSEREALKS
jgi:hypothetical protein